MFSDSRGEIIIWDVESGACLQTLNFNQSSVCQNGKIIIWNICNDENLKTIKNE